MKHSEFWLAVDTVFGAAYGRSLAQDLVLGALGRTSVQALGDGEAPGRVWDALCDETDQDDAARWVLRSPQAGHRRP